VKLEDLQEVLADFVEARDWGRFHTPKNLALALTGEVGELTEILQWKSNEEILELCSADEEPVGEELADVLIYVCQLANCLKLDLSTLVEKKLASNGRRYTVEKYASSAAKAPKERN
jgi:dCTP diphosphatase